MCLRAIWNDQTLLLKQRSVDCERCPVGNLGKMPQSGCCCSLPLTESFKPKGFPGSKQSSQREGFIFLNTTGHMMSDCPMGGALSARSAVLTLNGHQRVGSGICDPHAGRHEKDAQCAASGETQLFPLSES
ncbi:unnamed protein product [Menidia menidia]|uniref:(Atlantic silverside) hypothetical protein n=1 Tax=Menidia menidia TaxID=238744 RepID=A0A8S4AT33_9TELE|nr:unnamed protein product [Menidia menidia]